MHFTLLLVDDDRNQAKLFAKILEQKMQYKVDQIYSGQEAINKLTATDSVEYDLVLLDLFMPDITGVEVLKEVRPVQPNLPILALTGLDDVDMAVEAMKAGATDFLKKTENLPQLQKAINNVLRKSALSDEMCKLKHTKNGRESFSTIIGESELIKEMIEYGNKAAKSDIPVFIQGESGVGKELMARAIHNASDRKDKPFVAVNCGAIPENLVESILFGHEKGAFTGAAYKTFGKFREASGGTLFLDEVGELKPDIQVKLLRVLQEGEIEPVGSSKNLQVDVRIISATNRDLEQEVKEGLFREDLYYRLNVFPLMVPTLRDRKSDISLLVDYFLAKFSVSESKDLQGIDEKVMGRLCNFEWPGNIRQLKNVLMRAVVLCDGKMLHAQHFPDIVGKHTSIQTTDVMHEEHPQFIVAVDKEGEFKPLDDIVKETIKAALTFYDGCITETAKHLDIGRSTLYRKMEEIEVTSDSDA